MKYVITILLFFISLSSLYSCTSSNKQSDNSASIQNQSNLIIERFDKDLYKFLIEKSPSQRDSLISIYGDFLEAFGSVTINNTNVEKEYFFIGLEEYFSNPMLSKIYKDALSVFENIEPYEQELSKVNALIQTQWNGKQIPQLAMHVSGFKANTIVLDNLISISIDKYLGGNYAIYTDFFEDYQRQQMKPEMITRDYLKAWLLTELPTSNKRKDLLSEMINEGKVLYALEVLLPNWTEADFIGYTTEQFNWSKNKEKEIWKTTVSQNHLFNTDYLTIQKYMDDAPYTSTISKDSPGRLGAWIGWQIVKSYAENTNGNLSVVVEELDYQKILKLSKYNP